MFCAKELAAFQVRLADREAFGIVVPKTIINTTFLLHAAGDRWAEL